MRIHIFLHLALTISRMSSPYDQEQTVSLQPFGKKGTVCLTMQAFCNMNMMDKKNLLNLDQDLQDPEDPNTVLLADVIHWDLP